MAHPTPSAPNEGEPQPGKPNIPTAPDLELIEMSRLKAYPFLAGCSEIVLKKLQPHLKEQRYEAGATILQLGGYSDAAYYLASGVVGVRLTPVNLRREAAAAEVAAAPRSWADRLQEIFNRTPAEQAVQRAKNVGDAVLRTLEIGKSGRKVVDDSLLAMETVKEKVETTAENILTLAEQAIYTLIQSL